MANKPLLSVNSNIPVTINKKLQHIFLVLLITSTSDAAYSNSCWDAKPDFENCKEKAEQGDPDAQMLLGLIFNTERIPQNYQENVKWFKKAAKQGLPNAQLLLGILYNNRGGVIRNYQYAITWWKKAAEQGVTQAQNNLGWMYEHGQGVQLNFDEAAKWYKKSADQGNSSAQYNLGVLYEHGQGAPQNYVLAYKFYNLAALSGHEQAKTSKDLISRKMTRLQKKEAVSITTPKKNQ